MDKKIQKEFAQYLTNSKVANYMAKLLSASKTKLSILDPGAGEGILGISLLNSLNNCIDSATFVEIEENIFTKLSKNLEDTQFDESKINKINKDFVELALLWRYEGKKFDRIIMNPPYFKLNSSSKTAKILKQNRIQSPNIYTAFIWLALDLLNKDGELVAIVPRSFFNGLYFTKFRQKLFSKYSVDFIHVFDSRKSIFSQDSVLQENIIIKITNSPQKNSVSVAYTHDDDFTSKIVSVFNPDQVLNIGDKAFIRIPLPNSTINLEEYISGTENTDISVSTGPLVDFRHIEKIKLTNNSPYPSIPIIYPAHIDGATIKWPLDNIKKYGQYYISEPDNYNTDKNLLPAIGSYVVVKRISSKEESKRIVAAVLPPSIGSAGYIAIENHLNYFHNCKAGLDGNVAKGLSVYLNSKEVDEFFQSISGNTQVNVTDLKIIPIPSEEKLLELAQHYQPNINNFLLNKIWKNK